ncbi:BZ3500_MvSof-1268-A1-R1_Chr1-3g01661 [Microbotryum saponariae]|uniref:dolichyl-P-Glc:Man9GlcNAc2-PP-dolichol alpha-1,3-glucosyltransferase n=1 Tax=Microbotryum saponariae TaxID=289078 RepID=A0A2X0KEE3_9BASI|nr:BZ3500_MvSof-1268-A1-R1_Chr1-3g01661 [Microbotryum saponariae]SCZ94263.1 BZ3501_MvSof-1269-A2-R1_Chr1-3g01262 [Microbotryum saponariae]
MSDGRVDERSRLNVLHHPTPVAIPASRSMQLLDGDRFEATVFDEPPPHRHPGPNQYRGHRDSRDHREPLEPLEPHADDGFDQQRTQSRRSQQDSRPRSEYSSTSASTRRPHRVVDRGTAAAGYSASLGGATGAGAGAGIGTGATAPPSYSTRQLAPSRVIPGSASTRAPSTTATATATTSSKRKNHHPSSNTHYPAAASTTTHHSPWPAHLAPQRQQAYQSTSAAGSTAAKSHKSTISRRLRAKDRDRDQLDSASESGVSLISNFHATRTRRTDDNRSSDKARQTRRALLQQTDSPVRRWTKSFEPAVGPTRTLTLAVAFVVLVKCIVGLGEYSGFGVPPLRGDLEAQRHWLSLTSATLTSKWLHLAPSSYARHDPIQITRWYHHDYDYWRLDYPPLTAYHSLLLGFLARLTPRTAEFVTWRPPSDAPKDALAAWEQNMVQLEQTGEMKAWMRTTVIVGDLLVYISAVVVYCSRNYAKKESSSRRAQPVIVATLSVLLQPALILIDNGHFQYVFEAQHTRTAVGTDWPMLIPPPRRYNSLMLGLTVWALNFFQSGYDLLGAVAFVGALGFKQMALYYSPAIFAYLLGKCLYRGGRLGMSLFINLGFITVVSFGLLLSPFLSKPSEILQILARIFPFSRGLFEDKVANFWCAINVVVKLRQLASVASLARLALVFTLVALLPSVIGLLWISRELGIRKRQNEAATGHTKSAQLNGAPAATAESATDVIQTIKLLPHALFVSSMSFFMFSFQVHEKSILLPLMPITLLMGGREAGFGRMDWEWGVLLNNVGVFSMWPLLKRDGVGLAYLVLTLGWNYVIGYNPLALRRSFVKYLSIASYATIALLHVVELVASPPAHLPDLFVVMNLTVSCAVFGLGYLWASKRLVQEGWAVVGMK